MIEELKPCPFCGGEARLTYSTDNHKNPYVTCDTDNCPARNPYQWHYRTEDEAISAWNHRVIATERTAKDDELMPKWIPVTEVLPEKHQRVLVTIKRTDGEMRVRSGNYSDDYFWIDNGDYWKYNEVLAWMPLPEPAVIGDVK